MNWKKTFRRVVLIGLAAIVILCAGAYVAIHTPPAGRWIRAQAIRAAETRTGAQMEIRRVAIHWTDVGADLYGITVYGRGGPSEPPLFETPHLEIELGIGSLLRGRLGISKLVLDRPVLHFTVNQQGETNLPQSAGAATPSLPSNPLFALAVRHLAIRNGQIDYNDKTVPLSANLAGFETGIHFEPRTKRYEGFLRYARGRVAFNNSSPIENHLQANFVVSRSALVVDPLRAGLGKSRLTLQAKLTDFPSPDIRASYMLSLYMPEISRILRSSLLPAGEITTKGTLRYRDSAGPSFFDRVQAEGQMSSPRLAMHDGRIRAVATSARAAYSLEQGNLKIADLQANVLGGRLRMNSGEVDLRGRSPSRLHLTWQHASLKDLSAMLLAGNARGLGITGRADASANLSWLNDIRRMVADTSVTLHGQAKIGTSTRKTPLRAVAKLRYDGARNAISFRPSYGQVGTTKLSLNGTLSGNSNLRVKLQAPDLKNLSALVVQAGKTARWNRAAALAPLELQGNAQFSGRVSGSLQNPRLGGRLSARDLQVDGTQWQSVTANVQLSSSEIRIKNSVIRTGERGELRLNASAGLRHWSFEATRPVFLQASAENVSVSVLQKLAKRNYPVRGLLSADITVHGTIRQPAGVGTVRIKNVSAWEQPIQLIAIDLRGNGSAIQATAHVQTAAGALQADLTYVPQTTEYQLDARSSGIHLARLRAVEATRSGIEGMLALSASGKGTLANPELAARLTVSDLRVRGQSVPNAQAELRFAQHEASFTTQMALDEGTVRAKGSVALTGDFNAKADMEVRGLSLEPVLARYLKSTPAGLKGKADLQANISGPLKDPARIECHAVIPQLNLAYGETEVALVKPARLDYRDGVATIQKTELKGPRMGFSAQGTIPVEKNASMNVAVNGTVDLGLLRAVTSGINSSGRLAIQLAVRGPLARPEAQGNIRIENAALSSSTIPVGLGQVNGQLRLSGDRIEIQKLTGLLSGGAMSAQGFVIFRAHPVFNLALQAKSIGLRYPQGLLTLLDCDLRFAGTTENSLLSGRVLINQLALTKQFTLASFASQISSSSTPASPSPFERHLRLNVTVQSAQTLNLASSQLSVQGAANLTLSGTLANPVVLGRATIAQGEIFFMKRRYEIQNGTIEFSNPVRNNPVLNIYASTTVQQYNVTMNFVGPLDRLQVNYTSDPPLPPSDIINLIAFGETSEEAAASPVTPSVLGAESVLAQGVASQVTGKIQKLAGISQLTINPVIGGTQGVGAEITVQQRITGRLLLTFTTNTVRAQDAGVQVQYDATHKISVSGVRDQSGGYAVDVHFHTSF